MTASEFNVHIEAKQCAREVLHRQCVAVVDRAEEKK